MAALAVTFIGLAGYHETFIGHSYAREWSCDHRFHVDYDEVFPYVRAMIPRMPGDGGKAGVGWVRFRDACGNLLGEKFSWGLGMDALNGGRWHEDQLVFLGELSQSWSLPAGDCQGKRVPFGSHARDYESSECRPPDEGGETIYMDGPFAGQRVDRVK